MEFRDKQAIYLQIAEYVCEQILLNNWLPGKRIPSIRELARQTEVTPNTIQRTYDFLQQKEIISNKRGIGYFVEDGGTDKVLQFRKEQFIENELPLVFRNMYLLNISADEFSRRFKEFTHQTYQETK